MLLHTSCIACGILRYHRLCDWCTIGIIVRIDVLLQALLPALVDSVQQDDDAVVATYVNEASELRRSFPAVFKKLSTHCLQLATPH